MEIDERIELIERKFSHLAEDVLILSSTEETLKMILQFYDGTFLRVAERWKRGNLTRYSYYWLDNENKLKVGWDNAPHHKNLATYPHHKHVGEQAKIENSQEHCLEDVMMLIEKMVQT